MRLQQENDTLAHEIVVTKVGMQERITEVGLSTSVYSISFFAI